MNINGKTQTFGIIGNPIEHSFSPQIHSRAFQAIQLNAVYLPFLIEKKNQSTVIQSANVLPIQGFNVTVPFKKTIINQLDVVTENAKKIESVNTVWKEDQRWFGDSTDGTGFIKSLDGFVEKENCKSIQILGAGGSAYAIAFALIEYGIEELYIENRTLQNSQNLAERIQKFYPNFPVHLGTAPKEYDLLINATSIGLKDDTLPTDTDLIKKACSVIDIIYNPQKTQLLIEAEKLGKPIQNGLDMLLYQAAESFTRWTNQQAPLDVMRNTILNLIKN